MGRRKLIFLLWLVLPFIYSCNKEVLLDESWQKISLSEGVPLRDIVSVGEEWFCCGGIRFNSGFIYRSKDNGLSWDTVSHVSGRSLNTLAFSDNGYAWAAGDSLYMHFRPTQSNPWQFYWFADQVPPNEFDRTSFRRMQVVNDSTLVIAGGDGFGKGVFYISYNRGIGWHWKVFDRELSAVHFFDYENGLICGNGVIMSTGDGGLHFDYVQPENDFYTSFAFIDSKRAYCCSYDAAIYYTTNAGRNWKKIRNLNSALIKRHHLNDICITQGEGWMACGDGGLLIVGNGQDEEPQLFQLDTPSRLLRIKKLGNTICILSQDGHIFRKTL